MTTLALLWRPVAPPPLILGGALVLAALAVWAYGHQLRTRRGLAGGLLGMRMAVIAALAALLLGPSRSGERSSSSDKPTLTVLADTSASMLTRDCGELTRIGYVGERWITPRRVARWRQTSDVSLFRFDDAIRPLQPDQLAHHDKLADGEATRLVAALRRAIGEFPSGGGGGGDALLLSDGRDTDRAAITDAVLLARARGVRVHTVCLGGDEPRRDVAVSGSLGADHLFVNELGQLTVRVDHTGFPGSTASLRVTQGETQTAIPVSLSDPAAITVEVPVRHEQPGTYTYDLAIAPMDGEASVSNNQQSLIVEVIGRRMRVLLLEGDPHWDTKFVAQALRSDDRIELTAITRFADRTRGAVMTRAGDDDAALPETLADWARYDLVVLGRGIDELLAPAAVAQLPAYVEAGGHVIFARGRSYDPAAPVASDVALIEPVVWSGEAHAGAPLKLTPAGRAGPPLVPLGLSEPPDAVFAALPAPGELRASRAKPTARVLAESNGVPAIVSTAFGRGRVLMFAADDLWRWSMLPPKLERFSIAYDTLWSNAARWLVLGGEFQPGNQVSLRVSPTAAAQGSEVRFDIASRFTPDDLSLKLTVTDSAGSKHELTPQPVEGALGRWEATHIASLQGLYTATLASSPLLPAAQEKRFSVAAVDIERWDTSADPALMRALAEQTGGLVLRPEGADDFEGLLATQRVERERAGEPRWAWDRGWILTALLLWMGAEWFVRRRAGWL